MMTSVCFQGVSPVILNPRTVYNHMAAVIMCCDWDPDPPNILERDKVKFFTLNYTVAIRTLSDSVTRGERGWGVSVWRADRRRDLFPTQTSGELKTFASDGPLILPPEEYQHWSEISPLAASETFTQRRRRRIGTGSPHPNSSVNGARVGITINAMHMLMKVLIHQGHGNFKCCIIANWTCFSFLKTFHLSSSHVTTPDSRHSNFCYFVCSHSAVIEMLRMICEVNFISIWGLHQME